VEYPPDIVKWHVPVDAMPVIQWGLREEDQRCTKFGG
jgi:hypothetical protein